jgi:hypothetical protein
MVCTRAVQSPRANRSPASTCSMRERSRLPSRVSRLLLSSVTTWLTLTTQSRSSPAVPAAKATLPGAAARRRFDVIATTVTVLMRERLKASAETTSTGRRQAGAEPWRGPRSAHQTSLRATTSQRWPGAAQPLGRGLLMTFLSSKRLPAHGLYPGRDHGQGAELEPIGSCQVLGPPTVGSKSRPERQTPQTMARALDME